MTRRPLLLEFDEPISVETKPNCDEKDVNATKLITSTVTGIIVSMNRVFLLLILRFAKEKKIVVERKRGIMRAIRRPMQIEAIATVKKY